MDLPLWVNIVVVFCTLLLFLTTGMWIALALAVTGLITLIFLAGGRQGLIDSLLFSSTNSFVLVAVPMFILLGEIVLKSGLALKLYDGVSEWARIIPGGLLHSNIMSCSIFAAVSGSSLATAATLGTVAYRDQKTRGYDYRLIGGSVAAGGTLGIMIPPSIGMIIYGDFVGASVAKLFLGGVIPGLLLALLFMIWIAFNATIRPNMAPKPMRLSLAYFPRALRAFKDIWPMILIITIIFGGIYGGFMTPSEAAAVSVFVALMVTALLRKINFKMLKDSTFSTLRTSAMILVIVMFAKILGAGISLIRLPAEISKFVTDLGVGPLAVCGAIMVMYLFLGCFIEALSMLLLTLPVTYGVMVTGLGFDPIWFGIVVTLLSECALVTPPVGMNLYIIHGIAQHERFEDLIVGTMPFFGMMLVMLGLLIAFPSLATWLPGIVMPRY